MHMVYINIEIVYIDESLFWISDMKASLLQLVSLWYIMTSRWLSMRLGFTYSEAAVNSVSVRTV